MPITAFTVGTSRTINLGNFESLRFEASVTYELEPDGPPLEKYKELAQVELRKLMEETYLSQHELRKKLAK